MSQFIHIKKFELSGKIENKDPRDTDSGGFIVRVLVSQPDDRGGKKCYLVKLFGDPARAFDAEVDEGRTAVFRGRIDARLYNGRWSKDHIAEEYEAIDPQLVLTEDEPGDDFAQEDDIPF